MTFNKNYIVLVMLMFKKVYLTINEFIIGSLLLTFVFRIYFNFAFKYSDVVNCLIRSHNN